MNAYWLRLAIFAAAALLWPASSRSGEPNWPDHLTIGTASPGGTYYVYGDGLAKILTRTLDLPVVRLATDGPAQNIELLEAGEAKLGFVTIGIALQAWNGTGVWAGKKPARSMRAIFPMYDTPFQFLVLQESGIRSITEMAGKRVGVGPRGGTSAAYFPEFFNTLKVPVNLVFGEWAELAAQINQHTLDVLAVAAGVPFPSFVELEAKDKVRYIAFAPEQIATLRLAMPELAPSRIPAGTYPSLLRHYQTLGLYNFAVANADLPDDLVYNMVRAVFENHEEMMEAHAAAAATVPANLERNSFLPLHPGAIRYYRQVGKAGQTD
ncbi:MAG TPA: TAXI family TRAP transporter solute-binding subunit [Pseudolabrys sp.]